MGSELSHHQRDIHIDKQAVETTDFWSLYNGELLHGDSSSSSSSAKTRQSASASARTDGGGAGGMHHSSATAVSIFQGETVVKGQLWATTTPLDRATKNLMVYRHPSILRFIKSTVRGSQPVLITERCHPLSVGELAAQSPTEIRLGLRSILCALVFLCERAGARHLNVCSASVYTTSEAGGGGSQWRLAGFEHVWKAGDVTVALLELGQSFRSRRGVDADELKQKGLNLEQYAFGALCEEVLKGAAGAGAGQKMKDDETLSEFLHFCATQLKHRQASARPSLSSCLQHAYFNHDFIRVHSFLTELPLKSASDKQHFFAHLIERLRSFDEHSVAAQLGALLLQRMVLIDATAQLRVLPAILNTRQAANELDDDDEDDEDDIADAQPLFSAATFERFIAPRIVQLFGVRETQTRLVLLQYFRRLAAHIDERTMRERVLPELLLGIKDVDDVLVAATLRALADLVPLLGAATVIGRNRGQIFTDGRPAQAADRTGQTATSDLSAVAVPDWMEHRSITPVLSTMERRGDQGGVAEAKAASASGDHLAVDLLSEMSGASSMTRSQLMLLERLSPDGGEDEKTTADDSDLDGGGGADADAAWSDWEADAQADQGDPDLEAVGYGRCETESRPADQHNEDVTPARHSSIASSKRDEVVAKTTTRSAEKAPTPPEIDYFADMEPVIQKTNVLDIAGDRKTAALPSSSRLLAAAQPAMAADGVDQEEDAAGWGNDVDAWEDSS